MARLPLNPRIEEMYLLHFKKPVPDAVVPMRQLLRDARARERAEASEQSRRRRPAEIDHAEAARTSLLNIRRFMPGGLFYDDALTDEPTDGKKQQMLS